MVFYFFIGLALGCGIGWFLWWSGRREVIQLDEEKQMLLQEKLIVFDFMHSMVESIGEGISRNEFFHRVVHASILSTGALSACIFERDGDQLRGVAIEGLFPPHRPLANETQKKVLTRTKYIEQILKSEVFKVGEGLVGTAAQTGKGILIENAKDDPRVVKHDDPSLEVKSVIVVPISFRDRNIAVLAMVNPSDGGAFGENDFSLAESLAEQAGLAIHNLDLMAMQIEKNKLDSDLNLAHEIQAMLLPHNFPQTDQLDIASYYKPAQKVGGDLFDLFTLDNNRIGVAIADVSGKGVAASLIMAICQSNLRFLAKMYDSPAKVLKELNSVMVDEIRRDMFVTIIYAVIDLHNDQLTVARAGHELPIRVFKNNDSGSFETEFIKSEGMAIGMVPSDLFNLSIQDLQVDFCSEDIFVLYTDGLTETTNSDDIEYSNSRLADLVRANRKKSSQGIVDETLARIESFSGTPSQSDDYTLVTVKHR